MYEWDEAKRQANLAKHGADFADMDRFNWLTADVWTDRRFDYGENRKIALGLIGERLYYAAFTERGAVKRLISLRKANEREKQGWNMSGAYGRNCHQCPKKKTPPSRLLRCPTRTPSP